MSEIPKHVIEAAAKVLYDRQWDGRRPSWDRTPPGVRADYERDALIALEAAEAAWWQPIDDDTPKDENLLLEWKLRFDEPTVGYRSRRDEEWYAEENSSGSENLAPTRWRPLPQTPKVKP